MNIKRKYFYDEKMQQESSDNQNWFQFMSQNFFFGLSTLTIIL